MFGNQEGLAGVQIADPLPQPKEPPRTVCTSGNCLETGFDEQAGVNTTATGSTLRHRRDLHNSRAQARPSVMSFEALPLVCNSRASGHIGP